MTPDVPTGLVIRGDDLSVRKIGPWLRDALGILPAEEANTITSRLELALHEVAMNIIDHAGLTSSDLIRFSADITESVVEVRVTDPGGPFAPETEPVLIPGEPQERGYGLLIVRKLVDHLSYGRLDAGNRWILRINRTSRPDHGSAEMSTTDD